MIRTTIDHPKFLDLQSRLVLPQFPFGLPRCFVVGVLENLWIFTARYATDGGIGKWSNPAIARALEWPGEADALVDALLGARWLDPMEGCRLWVHDWDVHADDGVQRQLARALAHFANGAPPRTTRLNSFERSRIEDAYASGRTSGAPIGARRAPKVRTVGESPAPPRPAPPRQGRGSRASVALPAPPPPPPPAGGGTPSPADVALGALLARFARYVRAAYPGARVPDTAARVQPWLRELDRMVRLDQRPLEEVEAVIGWLERENPQRGEFRFVVQCPQSLRGKYDRIRAAMAPVPAAVNGARGGGNGRPAVPTLDDWTHYEEKAPRP